MTRRDMRARLTVPATFMVYDELGRVWPPGFVSQLCNPNHPNSILRTMQQQTAQLANRKARERVAESGEGWANGYLGPLSAAPAKVEVWRKQAPIFQRRAAHGQATK